VIGEIRGGSLLPSRLPSLFAGPSSFAGPMEDKTEDKTAVGPTEWSEANGLGYPEPIRCVIIRG